MPRTKSDTLKILSYTLAAILVGRSELCATADVRVAVSNAAENARSDPAAVRSAFLKRLRRLAREGSLFDPDAVARILEMTLTAELNQDQEDGLRYRRAMYKYEACRNPSDRALCTAHPDITWSDRELLREMVLQAYERCGTVNSFYLKEPATGELPLPLPAKHRSSPCDGLSP